MPLNDPGLAIGAVRDGYRVSRVINAASGRYVWQGIASDVEDQITSPDTQTFSRSQDGVIDFVVDGNPAGSITWDPVNNWPKWTVPGLLDPPAYLGTPQTIAQRNAMVPAPGWLVYVRDGAVNEYQLWNGTAWVSVGSAIAAEHVHLSATLVAPAIAGAPTLAEIGTAAGAARSTVLYFTGTNTPTDAPTHIYAIDGSGDILTLRSPATAAAAMTGASAGAAGAAGNVPPPPAGTQDLFLAGDATFKSAALDWVGGRDYSAGALAVNDGTLYRRATGGASAATWAADSVNWRRVTNIPVWQPNTNYEGSDVVRFNHRLYAADGAHNSGATFVPGTWLEISGPPTVVHLPEATVNPALPGRPTVAEIQAGIAAFGIAVGNLFISYTGTANATDPVLRSYFRDPDTLTVIPMTGATTAPMTGATGTTAGVGGTTPTPAIAQNDLVLHGDGLWRQLLPNWTANTFYSDGAVVYQNSLIVRRIAAGTSGLTFAAEAGDWQPIADYGGRPVVHLANTLVAPAVAGAPTLAEINTARGASIDTLLIYTGDDLPASTPTYVYHVDQAGTLTLLRSPQAVVPALVGATDTVAGAAGLAPQPAIGDQDLLLQGDGTWQGPILDWVPLTAYSAGVVRSDVTGIWRAMTDRPATVAAFDGAEQANWHRLANLVTNSLVFRGGWDASVGTFPGGGTAQTGDFYLVTTAGTVGGVAFGVGDSIYASTNNASATVYAGNWVAVGAPSGTPYVDPFVVADWVGGTTLAWTAATHGQGTEPFVQVSQIVGSDHELVSVQTAISAAGDVTITVLAGDAFDGRVSISAGLGGGSPAAATPPTTNTLTAASSAITSTVNGVASTLTPGSGTIDTGSVLGFNAGGTLVRGTISTSDTIQPLTASGAVAAWSSLVTVNSAAAATVTLPSATAANIGKRITVKNLGAGAATIAPNGADALQGAAVLAQFEAATYEVTAAATVVRVDNAGGGTVTPLAYGRMGGNGQVTPTAGAEFPSNTYAAPSTATGMTGTSTGRFAVATAGLYRATASTNSRGSNGFQSMGIYVNGVLAITGGIFGPDAASDDSAFGVDGFVTLAAGDVVTPRAVQYSASNWLIGDFVLQQVPTSTVVDPGDVPVNTLDSIVQVVPTGGLASTAAFAVLTGCTYTVPASMAGRVRIDMHASAVNSTFDDRYGVAAIHKNGIVVAASVANLWANRDLNFRCDVDTSCEITVAAGDVLDLRIKHPTGSPITFAPAPVDGGRVDGYCAFTVQPLPTSTVVDPGAVTVNDQAASGFIDLGGVRFQWGQLANNIDGTQLVTLPAPFASTAYSVSLTPDDGWTVGAGEVTPWKWSGKTTTGFNVDRDDDVTGTALVDWIAIGRKP